MFQPLERTLPDTRIGNWTKTMTTMTARNKRLIFMLLAIACILLIPLIAMQFTDEVSWSPGDFLAAAALLLCACLAFEVFTRRGGTFAFRATVGFAITIVVLVVWLELAVGIFGSPWAGT